CSTTSWAASSLNSGLKVLLVRFVMVSPNVDEVHLNTSNQVAKLTMPLQMFQGERPTGEKFKELQQKALEKYEEDNPE
ncbi:hypothetical protein, partial [Vibrio ouci]|uniref:hypothetical protein n=1 Tax=Vibrio ouci TaxID=2499078 RepID=UPI00142D5921